jgi:hypothetical protein
MRRVNRNHLARDQPIKEHAYTGEMLLNGWCRHAPAKLLYISGDLDRLDLSEATNALPFAPVEKFSSGPSVGRSCVRVADIDGEEFQEAELGPLPCPGDQRRQRNPCPPPFLKTTSSPMPRPYHKWGPFTTT